MKKSLLAVLALALALGAWLLLHNRGGRPQSPGSRENQAVNSPVAALVTEAAGENIVTNGAAGGVAAAKVVTPSEPAGGEIIAYRASPLAAKTKGGFSGELREWLIRPKEGYVSHLEEEWRPDATGELKREFSREYVANQVLLTVDGETSIASLRAEMAKIGATVKEPLMDLPKGAKIVAVMSPRTEFETVADLQDRIRAYDGRIRVEIDPIQSIERIPDDPRYRGLWGMENINAPAAWDLATEATNVLVAVLDTGVNYLHEDLTDNILRDRENLPFPYVVGYRSIGGVQSYDPMDDNGHGTHCAGTIAGRGNNAKGVAGVTWKTQIMPLKFINSEGKGATSDCIYCLRWARTHGAQLISCSFGCYAYSGAQETAMRQLGIMGAALACAAGNESENVDAIPHYPSSYDLDNIIAVASISCTNTLSEFSCYGTNSVDIAAPGEDIVSTGWTYTKADTFYTSLSGTSMATPHVAGAMTLLKGYYPGDVYQQTIQRILLNGADEAVLKDYLATGKRLDLYGAVTSPIPPSPVVTASAGTFDDFVEIGWRPVGGAKYYQVWRRWSEAPEEELRLISDWTENCVVTDRTAEVKTGYHYYVKCSNHEDGASASPLSKAAVGYVKRPIEDEWDHDDDQPTMATVLTPTAEKREHGEHTLSEKDGEDWFKVTMKGNLAYVFESTGSGDVFAELFNAAGTNLDDRVAYDDDSGAEMNFRLVYTPPTDGEHWLRVTRRSDENAFYRVVYDIEGWADEWDPADDTFTGATEIAVGGEETRHGLHSLSATDTADVFRFELTAGKTYVFKSTGDSDTFGELYFESSALGNMVAFNDDGHDAASGSELNFRIVHTPVTSGTYYLKVRTCRERDIAAYDLVCKEEAEAFDFGFTADELCASQKGWNKNLILVESADGTTGKLDFLAGENIYLRWAFNENSFMAVERPVKNLVELYNSNGERIVWGEAIWEGAIQTGAFIDFVTEIPGLPAGAYSLKVTLNSDIDGNPSHNEADRSDNEATVAFTVRDADSAVTALEISGSATIAAKGVADYRAIATFADGTTGDVSPAWSVAEGGDYAAIASDGRLIAAAVTQQRAITIRAVYGGQIAEKSVEISAEAVEIDSPFGKPTTYPSQPMKIRAKVTVNGAAAAEGDYIAVFAGNELRGTAKIGKGGEATVMAYVSRSDERLSFKVYSAASGDEGAVLACAETIAGAPGAEAGPITLTATEDDPFGTPDEPPPAEPGQKTGKATIRATVTINGMTAAPGDMLAVFDGARLAGKARISLLSSIFGLFSGAAGCTVEVTITGETELTFLVWDRSRQKLCATTTTLTLKPGDSVGTAIKPIEVEVNDRTRVSFWFPFAGWHLASTGLNPTDAKLEAVFASENGVIDEVKNNTTDWKAGETSEATVSATDAYWVHTAENDVNLSVEGEPDPKRTITLKLGWNLVGYPLGRAGRIDDVLRTALTEGKVVEIADATGVYPSGNLTMMYPGRGYWVRTLSETEIVFDEVGMISAGGTAANYGPFGDGSEVTMAPVMPVRYTGLKLTLSGQAAAFGDCVAFYGKTDEKLYAVAKVDDEEGRVTFPVYAAEGTVLVGKLWNAESGVETPQIFEAKAELTLPSASMEVSGATLEFGPKDSEATLTYGVTFELGEHLSRTGGGELSQTVEVGAAATAPEVSAAEGWSFLGWDRPFDNVRAEITVWARVEKTPETPEPPPDTRPRYTVSFDANGGTANEGARVSQECIFGEMAAIEAGEGDFTREGHKLLYWSTRPDGGGRRIGAAQGVTDIEAGLLDLAEAPVGDEPAPAEPVRLYAQWAKEDGFEARARTYVCNAGSTLTVPVRFDSALAMNCIGIKVAYDPAVMTLRMVAAGSLARDFSDDFTVTEPAPGTVSIALFAAKDTVPGAGSVAELTFTVREGTEGMFSDVAITDVQLGEESGVKDIALDREIAVTHGMVRSVAAADAVSQLENVEIVCADTRMKRLSLSAGDSLQASGERTPIEVAESVSAEDAVITVEAPDDGWATGRYAILRTPTEGLCLALADCTDGWRVEAENVDGIVTYYAEVPENRATELVSDDSLNAADKRRLRQLLAGTLPSKVSRIVVVGPSGMVSLISSLGIVPAVAVKGLEATVTYRTPSVHITSFDPESGAVGVEIAPGEGNSLPTKAATLALDPDAPQIGYSIDKVAPGADGVLDVVMTGEEKSAEELGIDYGEVGLGQSALYKVNVLVKDSASGKRMKIASANTFGLMRPDSDKHLEIVAVPWEAIGAEGGRPISVVDAVRTASLTPGDELYVYDNDRQSYRIWTLSAEKAWVGSRTIKVGADGQEITESGAPEDTSLARGNAIWLRRQDASKPVYLYGQYSREAVTTQIEADKWQLVAPPTVGDFKIADIKAAEGFEIAKTVNGSGVFGDQIFVPVDEGEPVMYTYRDDETDGIAKWGCIKKVKQSIGGMNIWKQVWTPAGDEDVIKSGTGFWYISHGGKPKIEWRAK